jgi:hypothetical protein
MTGCVLKGKGGPAGDSGVPGYGLLISNFVIVTQPRRIAAISMADRLAVERGERGAVGYSTLLAVYST